MKLVELKDQIDLPKAVILALVRVAETAERHLLTPNCQIELEDALIDLKVVLAKTPCLDPLYGR